MKQHIYESSSLTLRLLQQVVTPVGHVEDGEDGWEDDPGYDVDLLGPRGELVEPGLEEVPLLLRLEVDLARVQLVGVHQHVLGADGRSARRGPRAAHQRLLQSTVSQSLSEIEFPSSFFWFSGKPLSPLLFPIRLRAMKPIQCYFEDST